MATEELVKKQLLEALSKGKVDYSKILELSGQLASYDIGNARFSVDAGIIDRLGTELVARRETAVSELVKNSYDADAKNVSITFENAEVPAKAKLTIVDDGVGMTRDEIVQGFMRISSTAKIHEPLSRLFKRKRAGKKGIGRFAVQRLGEKLTIITQTKSGNKALKLSIDWHKYHNDQNLFMVANKIEEVPPLKNSGTTIIIEGLRDLWTEAAIKIIYRYVSGIIQPFPLSKEKLTAGTKVPGKDPGFKVVFVKLVGKKKNIIADEDQMLFKYAAGKISGSVSNTGIGKYNVESKSLKIKSSGKIGLDRENKNSFQYLKNISFEAYYFVYTPEFVPPQQIKKFQEISDVAGGIRLYKNGFRVLPYGEPFIDWLRLDKSVRSRQILPVHGNHNFFGFVEINSTNTGLKEETSSREGLQENEAFEELQNFIYRALITGVSEIARARGVKETASQKDWVKKYEKPPLERIKKASKEFTKEAKKIKSLISKTGPTTPQQKKAQKETVNRINQFASQINSAAEQQEQIDRFNLQEIAMLRILASLGLTIGDFTHEIRHYMTTLEGKVQLTLAEATNPALKKQLQSIDKNIRTLHTYASYFDEAVSGNVSRNLRPVEIRDAIEAFVTVIRQDTSKGGIKIEAEEVYEELFTTPMHSSEWASIFFNLYTNSKKAIRREGVSGKILIKAGKKGQTLFIEFSDNGDGIASKNKNKIFDAFFTTASPSGHFASQKEEILGTGLGLKIVFDIITSYQGSIKLVTAPKGYKTCFRIELPQATAEEMQI